MVYQQSTGINYSAHKTQLQDLAQTHITQVMVDLHWVPVKFRIIFKVLLYTFKAVRGIAPTYITSLLSFKHSRYNLRSVGNNTLGRPRIKPAKMTRDRAFAVAAPVLWNALPPSLRASYNIPSFKKQLKTHIFGYFRFVFLPVSLFIRLLLLHTIYNQFLFTFYC